MPIPLRLLAKGGKWLLEVERYVSVQSQLFRPRRETLEGEPAILRALESSEEAALRDTARTLMRGGTTPERCYEIYEGGFTEAAIPDSIASVRPAEERARAEEQELTRLRDQLLALHAKVERLRTQMSDLEQGAPPRKQLEAAPEKQQKAKAAMPPPAAAAAAAAPAHAAPEPGTDLLADEDSSSLAGKDLLAEDDSSSLAGKDLLADDDSSSLAGKDLLAEDEPAAAAPQPPAPLELGDTLDHITALDALLSGRATFSESTPDTTPGLLMIDESYFVSKLANESGESVGAVLVDGPTLKMLGCAVRNMSKAEMEAELTRDDMGEGALAGMKELAEAMVSIIARNTQNPTIFACDVEKLDPVELPWLFDVQKRVDLDDSLGGHVLLIGK
jgi:TolA-binding protein